VDWHHIKDWLEHAIGLNMDALHVYAGVFLQLLFALILRRPLSSLWPWLGVAALEFANEVYDYTYEVWPIRDIQFAEGLRDMWNTMAMPTLLLLLVRYVPCLFHAPMGAAEAAEEPSDADAGEAGAELG
jgi:hypothetical protein